MSTIPLQKDHELIDKASNQSNEFYNSIIGR